MIRLVFHLLGLLFNVAVYVALIVYLIREWRWHRHCRRKLDEFIALTAERKADLAPAPVRDAEGPQKATEGREGQR